MAVSGIERLVEVGIAKAQEDFPEVAVSADEFRAFVEPKSCETKIEQLLVHAGELVLTCACSRGDPAALLVFDRVYLSEVDRVLSPTQLAGQRDDLIQSVREKLFVGAVGSSPKIGQYRAAGALHRWVGLVIVRTFLDMSTQAGRMLAADTHSIADAALCPPGAGDIEVEYFKRLYRKEFADAFLEAVRTLEPSERVLLFHHYVERVTLDALADQQGVHRVTVARRIARIRDELRAAVIDQLRSQLELETDTIDSILRILESRPPLELLDLLEPTETTVSLAKGGSKQF